MKNYIEMPLSLSVSLSLSSFLAVLSLLFMVILTYIIPSEMAKTVSLTTNRMFP